MPVTQELPKPAFIQPHNALTVNKKIVSYTINILLCMFILIIF